MSLYSGAITFYGSNTDLSGTSPLIGSITALADVVTETMSYYKLFVKPLVSGDSKKDAAGNKVGNDVIDWEFQVESGVFLRPNNEYFVNYFSFSQALNKTYRWATINADYMHKLINQSLTTPDVRALPIQPTNIDTQVSEAGLYYYNITFENRKPIQL